MNTASAAQKPKRYVKAGPLVAGYVLSQMKPLHPLLPDHVRYSLPVSWNWKMLSTFLGSRRRRVYIDVHTKLDLPPGYQPAVKTDPRWAMSEADIRNFWERGFAGPFKLLEREEMQEVAPRLWRLWERESRIYPPNSYKYVGSTAKSADKTELDNETYARKGLNARDKHLEDDELMALYAHPAIAERMAQLLGPDILLWRSQFFPKYPGMGGTGWHQATSYLNETFRTATLTPRNLRNLFQLTAWVAVSDSTVKNGCMRFIPGTHRELLPMEVEEYDPVKHAGNKHDRFGTKVMRPALGELEKRAVNMEMKAGEFVIFSERTMHGALPNITTDDARLGMSARYIVPDVKIHNPWVLGEGGLSIAYLQIKNLNLDRWKIIQLRGGKKGPMADRVIPLPEGARRCLASGFGVRDAVTA
ncbi:MAG: phytanoyl-CoA dioxygenase family protein [Acidobacteriaceae bacterium]|nr:phytanoyl-CoA dioxygenase family protein [Acidobacteriaceae bacterium]